MKKLLALVLAALFLLSLSPSYVHALEESPELISQYEPGGDPNYEGDEPVDGNHDKPRRSKSLAYWEEKMASIHLTGKLAEDVLTIAQSQVGYSADSTCYEETASGGKKYYTRYGEWYGNSFIDWCDAFVSFCVYYAGSESYPVEASCYRHMMSLKRTGYWREWNAYVPKKGDIVFFALKLDKGQARPTHVGIVEEVIPGDGVQPGKLITIEGNQRNPDGGTSCVRRVERNLKYVVGYGTYERGKTYPEQDSVRSNGRTVIKEDSRSFVEYPTEAAMRFLGFLNTRYYAYWFPQGTEAEGAQN